MMSLVAAYDAGIMAGLNGPEMFPTLDLVDEAGWEDLLDDGRIECVSLVEAGLEEEETSPVLGGFYGDSVEDHVSGGVLEYTAWLMDGQCNLEDN